MARHCDRIVFFMGRLRSGARLGILLIGILVYQSHQVGMEIFGANHFTDKYFWIVSSIGCVIILAASFGSRNIQMMLNHKVMTFLGRISYSVYLVQFIVILCLLPMFVHMLNLTGIDESSVLLPLILCVSTVVTIALASITYRIAEVPSIKLGHWLTVWMHQRFPKV